MSRKPGGTGKGHTGKHSGNHKHKHKQATAKHHPRGKRKAEKGAARQHVHTVAKTAEGAKARKLSPGRDVACCSAEALAASLRLAGGTVAKTDAAAVGGEKQPAVAVIGDALSAAGEQRPIGSDQPDSGAGRRKGNGPVSQRDQ